MMRGEEKVQKLLDEKMGQIQVSELADRAILQGMSRAKKKRKYTKSMLYGLASAAILIISFTLLIRVSPAFAQMVSSIPGLGAIVSLVEYDKGIEDSVKHDYYEEIGASTTVNGVTFTLDGIIADETGMILSYTLEAPFPIDHLTMNNVSLEQNGEDMLVGYGHKWLTREKSMKVQEKILVISAPNEKIDYGKHDFKLTASFTGMEDSHFEIPFMLKQEKAQPILYEVNETVVLGGQKVTVHTIEISPLRAVIDVSIHRDNSMQIFDFDQFELIDENGETWGEGSGFTGYGGIEDVRKTYFIQSNYFRQPKELYLAIGNVQALPQNERELVIDLGAKNVVTQSADYPIRIENISDKGFEAWVHSDVRFNQLLFKEGIDANGKTVSLRTEFGRNEEEAYYFITIEPGQYTNPISFKLDAYPNFLEGSAKIRVK